MADAGFPKRNQPGSKGARLGQSAGLSLEHTRSHRDNRPASSSSHQTIFTNSLTGPNGADPLATDPNVATLSAQNMIFSGPRPKMRRNGPGAFQNC